MELNTVIKKANMGKRFAAFIIDHFVLSMLATTLVVIFYTKSTYELFSIIIIVLSVSYLLYLFKDVINGISFGKYFLGLQVRQQNGKDRATIIQLVIRNILLPFWFIESICIITRKDQKKIGDLIAKTNVYQKVEKLDNKKIVQIMIAGVISFFLLTIVGANLGIKSHESYEIACEHVKSNDEIISLVGEVKDIKLLINSSYESRDGIARASYRLKLIGENDSIKVRIKLEQYEDSDWIIKKLQY